MEGETLFSQRIDDELELRPVDERYAEELTALVRRDLTHLSPWMPWASVRYSVEDAREFIRRNIRQYAEDQGFSTIITFQGRVAGSIGYNNIDWSNRKTDIGYWLGADFQGRGLMTKSCRALVEYAFKELKLNRVEIYCATENRRSRAVAERLGFIEEGTHRQAEWVHDHFKDLVSYAVLAAEWKDKNRK
ncbi:MAG: ribosomal-protein-serine acetyltransferase [Acidobacteriota bacterium]|jgi:ribosomal-protein-serine acetyltransferase|nr:ribosomal-protein-serine acetyltransferase [Acidobacteriota bacterium]